MNRRNFISGLSLASSALVVPGMSLTKMVSNQDDLVTAETTYGKIRGNRTEGVNIFKGIPYAGKISGKNRFQRPAPLEPWTGIRDALQLGFPAIQAPNQTYGLNEPKPAEDCLYLNVWTPANDQKKRPVMFYNHGGGFSTGSGGSVSQDGANLARYFDVVVVETNHRLGIMGYLYLDEIAGSSFTGSGNMGMLDIVEGLKWVHKNISFFGGDPENVMIFGESGGGVKTSCLYAMPEAVPFFNKASIESGPGVRLTTREVAAQTTEMVFKELGISKSDWSKILDVPIEVLLQLQLRLPSLAQKTMTINKKKGLLESLPGSFSPVVDGVTLPNHPFDPVAPSVSKDKPLLVGWNEDEYVFFSMVSNDKNAFMLDFDQLSDRLKKQFGEDSNLLLNTYRKSRPSATASEIYMAIESINIMGLGSVDIAEKKFAQQGAPVYLYNFGYKSENKVLETDYTMGSCHAMDISFKFYNEQPQKDGSPGRSHFGGSKPERFIASKNMASFWTSFARNGKPFAAGAPDWLSYNAIDRPTMKIDSTCQLLKNRYADELNAWRQIGRL